MQQQIRLLTLKNKGAALISALFITALCAVIATALAVRGRLIIEEAEIVKASDQSYLNLQSVQFWAKHQIVKYLSQWSGLNGKAPAELRPITWGYSNVTEDGKKVSAKIADAQGRFNLNDLIYTQNQPRFAALITVVDSQITPKEALQIAQAVTDWMTNGTLDKIYLKRKPAYMAPKSQMADTTELRLVAGITADLYDELSPFVVALPVVKQVINSDQGQQQQTQSLQTPVDINSAPWQVLLTVNPSLTPAQAETLWRCRKSAGYFTSVAAFNTSCTPQAKVGAITQGLTTHSQYYLLTSQAVGKMTTVHLNSLLVSIPDKNNKLKVNVVWQAFY